MVAAAAHAYVDQIMRALWTENLSREHGFEPLRVEGALPARLRGTLYRNGPGQFAQFGTRYTHPFEADGATTAIRIGDGKALGASKVHATAGLVAERAAGRRLYGFAVSWPRRLLNNVRGRFKNTANTSVVAWQGRLFALMEAGRPTEIDPRDLSTIGETDLDGVIVSAFSAHPHRVAARRATYNFGLQYGYGRVTKLHMYELPDVGAARHLGAITLPAAPMLHDFIATESHLVFFVSPARVDVPRMLLGLGSFEKLFQWKPEHGTEVIAVPIDRPDQPIRFTTDAFYQWHFANAVSRTATEIAIDYVRYPDFDSFYEIGAVVAGRQLEARAVSQGRYHRATLNLSAKTLRSEPLADRPCEFPTVAPRDTGRDHAIAHAVFDDLRAIGSIDARGAIRAHELPADERVSEPVDADGFLLALCHVRDAAYVAVYDPTSFPSGPVAKIWFDHHVPLTSHGTYIATG
jgi:all-trans-8'-apo-beta-carotenal 15,15'-oxygenase